MRIFLLLSYGWLAIVSPAQDTVTEINSQVWRPFIETFNQYESDKFLNLHSNDLVRSARDGKQVLTWDQYLQETRRGETADKKRGNKRTLALRFTERLSNGTQAIDVGVYKTEYTLANGTTEAYYGRFHVVMRKEKNQWKILVDMDSSENGTIGEKDFLAAKPME